jgi:hypothetical protein
MTSVNGHEMAVIRHPDLYRGPSATPSLAPSNNAQQANDIYEAVRSPLQEQQARLADALQRVEHPSVIRRFGDSAAWSTKKVLQVASDTVFGPHEKYNDTWAWHMLQRFPPPGWCRQFVFDVSPARRAAAYKACTGLAMTPTPVKRHEGMGSFWSPRAIVLVRAMLHQLFGDLTEAEAITLVREGLERLKEDSVERRFVAPVLRADHMLGGENGNNYEIDAHPIRATVSDLRECFEHLAAHLEEDDTRRRIFSVPTSAYFPKLGIVEAQKKTTELDPALSPQRSGVNFGAGVQHFFSREGVPWKAAAAFGVAVVALVGAVVGLIWRRDRSADV